MVEESADEAADEGADVPVSVEVVVGNVVPELLAVATGSDLLVVGCRGLGAFSGLLLGSVSERLARRPPCPVVVVRGSRSTWSGPVVVGIDDAPETELAVEFAVAAADRRRVPLVALTAVPPVWPALPGAFPAESASTAEGAVTMLRELQEDRLEPALARHPRPAGAVIGRCALREQAATVLPVVMAAEEDFRRRRPVRSRRQYDLECRRG